MRLILQRVRSASVTVEDREIARIGQGILVLAGVQKGDGLEQVRRAADKLATLRIFEDEDGKMNLDTAAVGGSILLVSQFTLAGSLAKGRRPSFDGAAPGPLAEPLVEALAERLRAAGLAVQTGEFGAHMEVALVNDGPVTFLLEVPNSGL